MTWPSSLVSFFLLLCLHLFLTSSLVAFSAVCLPVLSIIPIIIIIAASSHTSLPHFLYGTTSTCNTVLTIYMMLYMYMKVAQVYTRYCDMISLCLYCHRDRCPNIHHEWHLFMTVITTMACPHDNNVDISCDL